ncbi:MAG: pyruvate kinase [bacterium]
MRKTKIVCTIGPASDSEIMLEKLIRAGINVARLNFSHGSQESHSQTIQKIRAVSDKLQQPIAILQDLAGPKIRIGNIESGSILLQPEQIFTLTIEDVKGDQNQVSVSYDKLPDDVQVKDRILLADGGIELEVVAKDARTVTTRVKIGGELSSRKGLNLPTSSLSVQALTEKDEHDLIFGLQQGVDYVAMSFVRRREDLLQVKQIMKNEKALSPIIAKIEKHEALENIDDIIAEADGIMVARGDLAVETPLEKVPLVQKMIIRKCNEVGKPVITATQMLKSMVDNPRPTRAETNDVANAVLDGTDAVMLSEETTIGQFPVESVKTMVKIIQVTESSNTAKLQMLPPKYDEPSSIEHAVSHGAFEIARDLKATAIFTPTQSGTTARMVSTYRPTQPIIAFSPNFQVVRCLNLVWGVHPLLTKAYSNSEEMIEQAKNLALSLDLVKKGEIVIVTAGIPVGVTGTTNLIKVEKI